MAKEMPTHKDWTALKKKHGVADGAVKGIDMGKAIDKYHASVKGSMKFALQNAEAAETLETVFATYIGKIKASQVKTNFDAFKKTFLDDYAGTAHFWKEDFKRYSADVETYGKEMQKFVTMVQKFKPNETTNDDLQKFRSGPLRGLTAVGSGLRDRKVDLSSIDKRASQIQELIDKVNGKPVPAEMMERVRGMITTLATEIGQEAHKQGVI